MSYLNNYVYSCAVVTTELKEMALNNGASGAVNVMLAHSTTTIKATGIADGKKYLTDRLKEEYPNASVISVMYVAGPV